MHEDKIPSDVSLAKHKGEADLQVVTSYINEEQQKVKDVSEEKGFSRVIRRKV